MQNVLSMKILAAIILLLVGARAEDPGDPSLSPQQQRLLRIPGKLIPDEYYSYPDDPVVPTYPDTCNYTEGAMCGDQCIRGSYCVCGFDKFYLRSFTGEK